MNNRRNLGDEIRGIVQNALNNKDFNRLNQDISNVVNGALNEVKRNIKGNIGNHDTLNNHSWKVNDYSSSYNQDSQKWESNNNNNQQRQEYKQNRQVVKTDKINVPVGKISGILLTVFGSISSIGFLIAIMVLAITGYSMKINVLYKISAFILLPCFIASLFLLSSGGRIRKRLKRYQRYIMQMHDRGYCMIKDLSSVTGQSIKYIAKDLRKMIDIGMFPEGHIDEKKTCFMINNESYEQYLKLQENMKMKEMEKQEDKQYNSVTLEPEISKAIDEGRQYVMEIRNANIAITGEEISRKLDRLEKVTGKIFDYVETHPEKFSEIKKFTEYFLPTTLKLLDAYREFDYQPVKGANISTAKKEIEETLDTINNAFENLLDGLFEDAAMDISTDISVMETMFAQEGLSQKNIKK